MAAAAKWRHRAVIGVGYLAGLAAYAYLPAGPSYQVWTSPTARPLLAFLLPTAALLISVLIRRVWVRDLVRDRDEPFEPTYESILFALITFVAAIHVMVMATLTGALPPARPWLVRATMVLFGLTVARVGNLLPRTRPNLAIGIRTPHTLADRRLWMHTHRLAGYLAVALGLLFVVSGAFLPKAAIEKVIGSALAGGAALFTISMYRYRAGLKGHVSSRG
jgi:uncharacterized protein YhhL (DUF1145 family)